MIGLKEITLKCFIDYDEMFTGYETEQILAAMQAYAKSYNNAKDKEISSLNEILKQKMELLVKANERIEELEKQVNSG